MTTQQRLDKYMSMRKKVFDSFLSNPSLLSTCSQLIGQLEMDIRQCRKELGLPEWNYL